MYHLTYKGKPYGMGYRTVAEVEGALVRVGRALEGLGWTKCSQ